MNLGTGNHVKYLLIGGGVAASAGAVAIRQNDPEGSILLVGQEINRPYHRPPLSREYLLGSKRHSDLFTLPDDWLASHTVLLRTARRAARLDLARNIAVFDNGREISFTKLLIATGGAPKPLDIPGAELPGVYYLRIASDADRLRNAIDKARQEGRPHPHGRGRVAIIGAGLLGVELAATFTQLGLAVDLVFRAGHPWSKFAGESTGRLLMRYLEQRGVALYHQATPLRLEGDGRVQRLALSDRRTLQCDFVVPAIGMVPNKDVVRGTTIRAEKAILVDDHCRTSAADVYAAGDCAAIYDPLFEKYRPLDHWDAAVTTGTIAGRNMAGADEACAAVNFFSSQVFDLSLNVWGDARLVERRIIREKGDSPLFIEFGVAADGRLAQVLAIGSVAEPELLRELVHRRVQVVGKESTLRDPAASLDLLLT